MKKKINDMKKMKNTKLIVCNAAIYYVCHATCEQVQC